VDLDELAYKLLFWQVMRFALKVLKTVAVCWISLTVTVSGLYGMVLCISNDGHFSLEIGHEGRCRGTHSEDACENHPGVEISAEAGQDCRGDCIDVSLTPEVMSHLDKQVRRGPLLKGMTFQPLTGVLPAPDANKFRSRASLREARSGPSPALLAQRTVVLRT
jgi:hypothetical protein